jgi:hypothetical protein
MRVLVCGGRDYNNYSGVELALNKLPVKPTVIIHGDAKGADTLAKMWAMSNGVYPVAIPALWDYFGNRAAGPKRNQAMLDIMSPDYCVAFPGKTGTADMIQRCIIRGIPVWQPYD